MRGEYTSSFRTQTFNLELPPRARRIPHDGDVVEYGVGTTSACAENTGRVLCSMLAPRNYLRMRGEYQPRAITGWDLWELPPHARRIRSAVWPMLLMWGTTSACAENTHNHHRHFRHPRNYLRMRGEYKPSNSHSIVSMELPPHARRILGKDGDCEVYNGTTSACAENTIGARSRPPAQRNYLRMRGEYWWGRLCGGLTRELPPHARRIPIAGHMVGSTLGTTSACAENTAWVCDRAHGRRNYLRMRGEYPALLAAQRAGTELPPHARRIPQNAIHDLGLTGTTSACAENTKKPV